MLLRWVGRRSCAGSVSAAVQRSSFAVVVGEDDCVAALTCLKTTERASTSAECGQVPLNDINALSAAPTQGVIAMGWKEEGCVRELKEHPKCF